ncbi:MAG: methylmalonyl-CoA mutase family protein, partial [Hyphomicrobiaceae bacterium]
MFPPKTEAEWRTLVDKALGEASYASLVSGTHDGLEIQPLYIRPSDEEAINASVAGFMAPARRTGNTTWDIRSLHTTNDPATANTEILDDLLGGVNSICLQMEAPAQSGLTPTLPAMGQALSGAHLDMIHLSVLAGDQYIGAALALTALWDDNGIKTGQRRGAVNADPLGHLARTGGLEDKLYDTLRTLAHFISTNHAEWPDVTLM